MNALLTLLSSHFAVLVEQHALVKSFARLILVTMLAMAPLDAQRISQETPAELQARYEEISMAIASAAWHPDASQARYRAAILLGIARHESGLFELDVDTGPCRSAAGDCDGGRSVSIFQLLVRDPKERRWLQHNREAAAARALRIALGSISACPSAPFARYASGNCEHGLQAAAELRQCVYAAHLHLDQMARLESDPYEE